MDVFGAELEDELVEEARMVAQELREVGFTEEHHLRGGGDLVAVEEQDLGGALATRARDHQISVKFGQTRQGAEILSAPGAVHDEEIPPYLPSYAKQKSAPAEAGAHRRER